MKTPKARNYKNGNKEGNKKSIELLIGLLGVLIAGWAAFEAYKAGYLQKIGLAQQQASTRLDQRAYASVIGTRWNEVLFNGSGPRYITAGVKVVVTGKTAAKDIKLLIFCKVVPNAQAQSPAR